MISSPYCAVSRGRLRFCFDVNSPLFKISCAVMDASSRFTLNDLEQSNIEAAANQPGRDGISTCTCSGVCMRASGRYSCPCLSTHQFCMSSCHREATMFVRLIEGLSLRSAISKSSLTRAHKYKLLVVAEFLFLVLKRLHHGDFADFWPKLSW